MDYNFSFPAPEDEKNQEEIEPPSIYRAV